MAFGKGGRMWRALEHRSYRLFFFGQLISNVGTWLQIVARSWLVYRLTGSAAFLGFVSLSGQLPTFFLAPYGGTLADRFERRKVLIVTQVLSMMLAFGLGALCVSGRITVEHVFVLAAAFGVV